MGPSPGNWLAAHRTDLTLGKTAICIFVAKFYGSMLSKIGDCLRSFHHWMDRKHVNNPKGVYLRSMCNIWLHTVGVFSREVIRKVNSLPTGQVLHMFFSLFFFLSAADLLSKSTFFFRKTLSGIPSEYQTVWIQIRRGVLSGLIWI